MSGEERVRLGPARPLFTVAEAAEWTGARVEGVGEGRPAVAAVLTGVEVDSRLVRPGDLFCALPGERTDGHAFVGRAMEAGALAALVARRPDGSLPTGRTLLLVSDPLAGLGTLARRHRDRFDIPVVAVTGSVGKTTTKDLIASALGAARTILANPGNLNTDIGLPLTLFQLGPEHEMACLEMAMRGPGEITRLAAVARPVTGVVTNVGPVHIELLGSVEAIARAKEELLWALPEKAGTAVLNADDPIVAEMAERHRGRLRVVSYGLDQPADVTALDLEDRADGGTDFRVRLRDAAGFGLRRSPDRGGDPGDLGLYSLPLGGRHSVSNALAAVAVALVWGVDPEAIRAGLRNPRLSAMRQETTEVGGVWIVNDAYNAGPTSMRASVEYLAALRTRRGGRAVAVLGDMLELGDYAETAHRQVGRVVARARIDRLVTVGPRSVVLADAAVEAGLDPARVTRFVGDAAQAEAAAAVLAFVRPGDTVLVKASRGMKLEKVVEELLSGLGRPEGGFPERARGRAGEVSSP